MPDPTTTPNASEPPKPQRCRYIKAGGDQCRGRAFENNEYCWHHHCNGTPQFAGVPGFDRVPLLEDAPAIQSFLSNVAQGILDGKLPEGPARALIQAANVADSVLRTQLQHERWLAAHNEHAEESVAKATNLDSRPLAPAQEYRGPGNKFEPTWSFSKYRYVEECKSLAKALPQSEADMPASGWISEEEAEEDVQTWAKRYEDKIDGLKAAIKKREEDESAAALAAGLPDPHPKPRFNTDCPYGIDWCAGYRGDHRCTYCKGNLDWNGIHPDQPPIDPPDYSPLAHGAEPRYNTADWLRRKAEDAANQTPESGNERTEDPAAGSQRPTTLDLKAEAAVPELSALSSEFCPAERGTPNAPPRPSLSPVASGQWPAASEASGLRPQPQTKVISPHPCRAGSVRRPSAQAASSRCLRSKSPGARG